MQIETGKNKNNRSKHRKRVIRRGHFQRRAAYDYACECVNSMDNFSYLDKIKLADEIASRYKIEIGLANQYIERAKRRKAAHAQNTTI